MAVSVIASYVALDLASRVTASARGTTRNWLLAGAVSMGMGIWSMHFIAMLAFRLPIPMSYDVWVTALSLLIAVTVSGFALHTVSRERLGRSRLLGGGVLMGIGIAAMHYTGMAAMQMSPPVRYDPGLFALSIVVAVVVAMVALWLAFRLRGETLLSGFWRKAGSAILMGAAICGMHYTGMAAAIFPPHSVPLVSDPGMDSGWLALAIGTFTFMLLFGTLLVSLFDAHRVRDLGRAVEQNADLQASEQWARAIVDHAHDAFIGMDAAGNVIEWNPRAAASFGWSAEEAIGQPLHALVIPPRLRASHQHALARFLATGEGSLLGHLVQFPALHRDGHEFPAELTISAIPVGDTHVFSAFLRDISERQHAEEIQARFAAIIESSSDAIIGKTLQGIITSWNPGAERMFGYTAQEAVGQPMTMLIPPERIAEESQILERIGRGERIEHFETVRARKDGSPIDIAATISPIKDGAGAITGVSKIARDISERKRAQEELDRFFELSLNMLCIATFEGYFKRLNPAWEAVLGYTREELMARPFIEFVHPDDRAATTAVAGELARGQETRAFENRYRCKDGTYKWLVWQATPTTDRSLIYAAAHDVTERREAEAQLQAQALAAESASRAKSDFLANMSHEIRTPMNGVLGTLGLLLDSSLSGTQRELAGLARASGETLLSLINDILDFSKIEAGKMSLEPIPFDLLRASEGVANMMAALAGDKDLDLILRYAPDVPRHVIGDPGRIRQVLTNLLSNAIKFTDKGQVLVDVVADAVEDDAVSLRFRVEDTGLGITRSQLERVFDKFTQADASTTRRHGGTGLGLAISSQLVELMGGTIGADSVPGEGSTFWFTLRLPLQKNAPPPALPPADLAGVRVLIVDDNDVNRRVLHEQVIGWKMRNGSCASADEALRALRAAHAAGDPYGIAILDYQMPGTDGEGLGRAIKDDPDLREVSLIMLTSMGQRGDVARLKAIGFAAYLVKPARQSELLDALATVWSARIHQHDPGMVTRHTLLEERALRDVETPNGYFNARVLLAEDHPTNQIVASMMLRNLGCTVDLAGNGREAIEMLGRSEYDVVFMDCEMPVMDGFEATAKIRLRADARSRIPIIAVTAQAMQGDRERCLRAGMDDYISKPVQTAAFAAALQRWTPTRARPVVAAAATGGDSAGAAALDVEVIARLRALAVATDPSLLEQIFASFQRDGAARIVALQDAAHRGDVMVLHQAAHALKGASGNIGALALADLAGRLEAAGEAGALADVASQIEQLQAEFVRVASEIAAIEADAAGHPGRPA